MSVMDGGQSANVLCIICKTLVTEAAVCHPIPGHVLQNITLRSKNVCGLCAVTILTKPIGL